MQAAGWKDIIRPMKSPPAPTVQEPICLYSTPAKNAERGNVWYADGHTSGTFARLASAGIVRTA